MADERMRLEEGFRAEVRRAWPDGGPPVVKPRHAWIGWSVLLSLAVGLGAWWVGRSAAPPETQRTLGERPGLSETLRSGKAPLRTGGVLRLDVVRGGVVVARYGPYPNLIVNAGETALRDCFGGTGTPTCTVVQNFKYHGIGTSSTAPAEGDTGCVAELTTEYNPDNTRATGSQTNNGANVYRTVGTNTVDAGVTIQEFCLMSQAATGGGTMWTRILTGGIALSSGDSLQTTYDLTIE